MIGANGFRYVHHAAAKMNDISLTRSTLFRR